MDTLTPTHEQSTSKAHEPPLDIEKYRARLQAKVLEKQAHEDAVLAHLSEQEKLAVDVAAAIVEICKGVIDGVQVYPVASGYQLAIKGTPAVNIGVRRTCEPHTAISVEISGPKHLPGSASRLSCHTVDAAVSVALGFIGN